MNLKKATIIDPNTSSLTQNYIEKLVNLRKDKGMTQEEATKLLLENYMYYAYHHRVSEFMDNYSSTILTWQMETEVDADGNA